MYTPENTYVAIMAGGVGSRFWPASREAMPKQFLDILGVGKSLLQLTFDRFRPLCPVANIYIVTNAAYRDLVLEQLPDIQPAQILAEPIEYSFTHPVCRRAQALLVGESQEPAPPQPTDDAYLIAIHTLSSLAD